MAVPPVCHRPVGPPSRLSQVETHGVGAELGDAAMVGFSKLARHSYCSIPFFIAIQSFLSLIKNSFSVVNEVAQLAKYLEPLVCLFAPSVDVYGRCG